MPEAVEAGLVEKTTAAWKAAGERGDAAAATACLAEGVELISPLTARFRFRGREQVGEVLTVAFQVTDGISYHTEVGDGRTRAVFFTASCRGLGFEEAQLLRFDGDGLIREITMFGRPLPGVTAVMAALGPRLVKRQGRALLSAVTGAAVRPLAAMVRAGDRLLVPLADPERARRR
ncbi:hypothetical protein J0910_18205 [Nocardiopsis sp. CNT-189]|uniref:hypothetical protein n=1 Tax=Nocardiopsis oceanisediminis TaxID=2816862 RepID=UPI003B390569